MNIIEDLEDPRVEEFRHLKKLKDNEIIADSHKVISKLLSSGMTPLKFFTTEDYAKEWEDELSIHYPQAEFYCAPTALMEQIVGHQLHHGIMVKALRPNDTPLAELDDKIIVLNGLTSPENVGTIIRSATAFGIRSVLVDLATASPWLRRTIRVSMGNVFFAKIHHSDDLIRDLQFLAKEKGLQIVGTANAPESLDLPQHRFNSKTALIIGSEGHGMQREVYQACDLTLRIPMREDVAHLNAAAAAAICLYQLSQY